MINPQSLSRVKIGVRDFDTSIAWYKEHFGFERMYGFPDGVVIGRDGVEVILSQVPDPDSAVSPDENTAVCLRSFGLEVSMDDLAKAEVEFELPNETFREHPRFKHVIIHDPDGHAIELYVNKRV